MVFRVSKLLEITLFFVLNLFIYLKNYLCDCSRSLIFIMACGIFRSSLWTLSCSMWIPVAPCGIQSPDQGLNPAPTLHWGLSVLATGPPRKSLGISLLLCNLWGQTNFSYERTENKIVKKFIILMKECLMETKAKTITGCLEKSESDI